MEFEPDVPEPPGFLEARRLIRDAIRRCEAAGIAQDTMLTVILAELVPRLVEAYGAQGVAGILTRVSAALGEAGGVVHLRQ